LAATEMLTAPLPLPLLPAVTVIHASLLVAVHVQLDPLVTSTLPLPPSYGIRALVGESVYVQFSAWLIVNVCAAIVIVPYRAGPVFDATE